jgi:riboflavin synthase
MFTGLVQSLGEVIDVLDQPPGHRLTLRSMQAIGAAHVGDSIAINGCCLTVVEVVADRWSFEAGPETLRRTNLGSLTLGSLVNLERSLAVGDLLGGHFVTGHIDGVGSVVRRDDEGAWTTMWFGYPAELGRQLAPKGSVAVDGVSLTLVEVTADAFSVALIPHTLSATTLGRRAIGDHVNLETDLLAKYVGRLVAV